MRSEWPGLGRSVGWALAAAPCAGRLLERVSRLTPTDPHRPDIVMRNFKFLKGMLQEAIRFGTDEGAKEGGAGRLRL